MSLRHCIFLFITTFIISNGSALEIYKRDNFLHVSTYGIEVYSIYRDPISGVAWLGTNQGLFKYDNTPLKKEAQSIYPDLLTNSIKSIQGMEDGTLLLRTVTRQYMLYNPILNEVKDDFKDIFSQWGLENVQPQESEIIVDDNKHLWIYSGKCLWYYNPAVSPTAILKTKVEDNILKICVGKSRFYILTSTALIGYEKETSNVLFKSGWLFPDDIRNLTMEEDKHGNIWAGSKNLYRYMYETASWETIFKDLLITGMVRDENGDVYIASSTRGIVHYNAVEDEIENIMGDPLIPGSLTSNRLHSIFIDVDNNLWISYNKQDFSIANNQLKNFHVCYIDPQQKHSANNDVISLAYAPDGILWMGTDGNGLYKANLTKGKNAIHEDLAHKNDLKDAVTAIYIDSSKRLWIGLYHGGLLCKKGDKWENYLEGMSPYSIVENSRGEIYVGLLGDGVYYFPTGNDDKPRKLDTKGSQYVMQLFCDKSDTLYIATTQSLLAINTLQINSQHPEKTEYNGKTLLKDYALQSIYKDSRGLLWLISSQNKRALGVFDIKSDSLIFNDKLSNINIKSIIEDNNHTMWGISDNCIINIIINRDSAGSYCFHTFTYPLRRIEEDVNYYNYRSAAKLPDGTLIFGGIYGYRKVVPEVYETLRIGNSHHKVCLASLQINNEFVGPGISFNGRQILKQDISLTESINLKHYENNLAFTLRSQDYANPFRTVYCYRLHGLSNQWQTIQDDKISLSNLMPGKYVLEVSAYNFDGSMTNVLSSLLINVEAPWYMTTVAYVLYAIIVLLIIILVILYFIEKQRQQLRLNLAQAEIVRQHQLNEMKVRFFNNISHDLRTPLTLILTPLEAYLDNNRESKDIKLFTSIYKNAQRLFSLINQILDFRKLETHGITLNLSNGDIVAFIKDICSSFAQYAEDTHIELKFSSTESECNMMFDKDKVEKIMMNLLSNAFKYASKAGEVRVELTKLDGILQISVIDNGCGIPDNEKQAVFQRFYQSQADKATHTGCGIGLHIVKEFVTLHHGNIEVKDNQPTGSIFIVTLPIERMSEEEELEVSPKNSTEPVIQEGVTNTDQTENRGTTILLVEDNEEFLGFLADSLAGSYHILCAANGIKALSIMESNPVDLIVSDIMMDEMDGLKLCQLVKSDIRYSHIPVILLTAKAMVEDEIQGLKVGADDYIIKPFNLSILKLRINNLLKDREASHLTFKTKIDINPSEITITSLDEQFLSQAIAIVEENMADPEFSVEDLSRKLGIHRTHLYRKLYGITGMPPIEFIRSIRLKRACQYLRKSQMYVSEIAYAVGFNSPKLFSKYFKQEFNMSPKEYMKQGNQDE